MWVLKYNTLETNIFPKPNISSIDKNTGVDKTIKLSTPPSDFRLYTVDNWEERKAISKRRYTLSQLDLFSNMKSFKKHSINCITATIVTSILINMWIKKGTSSHSWTFFLFWRDRLCPACPGGTGMDATPLLCPLSDKTLIRTEQSRVRIVTAIIPPRKKDNPPVLLKPVL